MTVRKDRRTDIRRERRTAGAEIEDLDALEMSMQESLNGFYGQLRTLQVEERKKVEAELRVLEANIAQWEKEGDGAGGADDGARELSSTIAKLKQQLASGAASDAAGRRDPPAAAGSRRVLEAGADREPRRGASRR